MRTLRLLLPSIILTALLAVWFLPQSVRFLPLVHADMRAALARSLDGLEARGIWLVNVVFDGFERRDGALCVRWIHQYRGRVLRPSPEIITICP